MGQVYGQENMGIAELSLPEGHAIDGGKRVRVRKLATPALSREQESIFFAALAHQARDAIAALVARLAAHGLIETN